MSKKIVIKAFGDDLNQSIRELAGGICQLAISGGDLVAVWVAWAVSRDDVGRYIEDTLYNAQLSYSRLPVINPEALVRACILQECHAYSPVLKAFGITASNNGLIEVEI